MAALTIMVQGTGSYVGKSVLAAALCRYFRQQGYRVAPFKAQNMSNNSFVTPGSGEIGRAQAFQAACCDIEPAVEMNPILLKPASDLGSQVVVLGRPVGHMRAREYHEYQAKLVGVIEDSFNKLAAMYGLVVIEGAGSPAEINLRKHDITNMFVAKMAKAPVLLVGDIHVGGVFASLVGTMELLADDEADLVKAFIINKFRGDITLLNEGLRLLEERTQKKVIGVIPYVPDLGVDEEDGIQQIQSRGAPKPETLRVVVVRLPHISNSTDFESLAREQDVSLHYVTLPAQIVGTPDVVILPGTKTTVADLKFLHASGLAAWLHQMRNAKVPMIGICGGFQMMGSQILDPYCVESEEAKAEGLGFLPISTSFEREKRTVRVQGINPWSGQTISGYEIHMGSTETNGILQPLFQITQEQGAPVDRQDGCISSDGLIWGTYIHGLFDSAGFRRQFLNHLRLRRGWGPLALIQDVSRPTRLDALGALIRNNLDCEMLNTIVHQRA